MATVTQIEPAAIDGRRARRERGRLAVVDAMVDLLREGHRPPGVDAVADRAGVSVASVFRYFDNLDDLQNETTARFFERYAPLFDITDIGVGSLGPRIDRYVDARIRLYETTAPIARFARARALDQPRMAVSLRDMRRRLAAQARRHFEPELRPLGAAARTQVVASIATLTAFEAWDALRNDLDVSAPGVRRAWRRGVRALLSSVDDRRW